MFSLFLFLQVRVVFSRDFLFTGFAFLFQAVKACRKDKAVNTGLFRFSFSFSPLGLYTGIVTHTGNKKNEGISSSSSETDLRIPTMFTFS